MKPNVGKTVDEVWGKIQDSVYGMEGVEVFHDCINVSGKNARHAKSLVNKVHKKLEQEGLDGYLWLDQDEDDKWFYIDWVDTVYTNFDRRSGITK